MLALAATLADREGFRQGGRGGGALFLLHTGEAACMKEGAMGRWATRVVRTLMPDCPGATARSLRRATAEYFSSATDLGDEAKEGAWVKGRGGRTLLSPT